MITDSVLHHSQYNHLQKHEIIWITILDCAPLSNGGNKKVLSSTKLSVKKRTPIHPKDSYSSLHSVVSAYLMKTVGNCSSPFQLLYGRPTRFCFDPMCCVELDESVAAGLTELLYLESERTNCQTFENKSSKVTTSYMKDNVFIASVTALGSGNSYLHSILVSIDLALFY